VIVAIGAKKGILFALIAGESDILIQDYCPILMQKALL
jgi:hypothetical protein